jgi:hypothetical protein
MAELRYLECIYSNVSKTASHSRKPNPHTPTTVEKKSHHQNHHRDQTRPPSAPAQQAPHHRTVDRTLPISQPPSTLAPPIAPPPNPSASPNAQPEHPPPQRSRIHALSTQDPPRPSPRDPGARATASSGVGLSLRSCVRVRLIGWGGGPRHAARSTAGKRGPVAVCAELI